MIIDFRLRPPIGTYLDLHLFREPEFCGKLTNKFGFERPDSANKKSMDLLLEEMKKANISAGVAPGRKGTAFFGATDNQSIQDIVTKYPKQIIGVAGIDPSNVAKAIEEIELQVIKGKLVAINLEPGILPQAMYGNDRRIYPLYDFCQSHNIPVLIMLGGGAGPDISYSAPVVIDQLATDFPKLNFIITHGGWPWVTQVLSVALRRPNIYICPDMYMFNMPGISDYIIAANGFLSERFLFGSSYPFIPLDKAVESFLAMPFKKELLANFMHNNAIRALNLNLPFIKSFE